MLSREGEAGEVRVMEGAGSWLRGVIAGLVGLILLVGGAWPLCGEAARGRSADVPALLVSDIHFEPFYDPGKVAELAGAPAGQWGSLLAGPATASQAKDFAALEAACYQRGSDTTDVLWRSSLEAMKGQAAGAGFLLVSGDLLAHNFDCKFKRLFPGAKEEDYVAFAVKTIRYVVEGMRAAFPGTPIYVAMGNNDTGCGDYRDERNSVFLGEVAKIVAETLPAADRVGAVREFVAGGVYSAALPVPHTRVLVIDSTFLSSHFLNCAGKPDAGATDAQVAWLRARLGEARGRHQRVWVLGHIPPGVDLYSTLRKLSNVCGEAKAQMFLGDERMAQVLASYSDVVRLAVFGHSHTDELRLLTEEGGGMRGGVAVKIVTSISPVNGNTPAFTLGRVDPATATLRDYTVFAASNLTGMNATWGKEYTFSETYHQPRFTPATLRALTNGFEADGGAVRPESAAYLREVYVGDRSALLKPLWPEYVCALTHDSAASYAGCVCKK